MPRRKVVQKRKIEPDPKYNSRAVAKFISRMMLKGKKSVSRKILYRAFDIIEERLKKNPLEVFLYPLFVKFQLSLIQVIHLINNGTQ